MRLKNYFKHFRLKYLASLKPLLHGLREVFNYANFWAKIFERFCAIDCAIIFYVLMQSIAHKKWGVIACLFAAYTYYYYICTQMINN